MVFMTYANVVFSYGIERFCQKMVEGNVSGLILPDVSYILRFWFRNREMRHVK